MTSSPIPSPPTSHCEKSGIHLSYHGEDLTVEEYKRRLTGLSEKLRAVTVMNDKWQKYDSDREKYVKCLRADLENTKKLVTEKEKELSETRARERQFEKTVKDQQKTISNFSKLMDELDQKDDRERALMMRVRELEQEVDSLKRKRDRPGENSESVKLLQQQLEVCIDDFKTEKKEKERYRDEARTFRKKSEEVETLLHQFQEKVALIKSLEFPTIPDNCSRRQESSRRTSSARPRELLYQRPPKPSSWSYPSEFPSFSNSIEADGPNKKGSQSDTAVNQAGASVGVPSKPLIDLFPYLKQSTEKTESGFGSDSVFPEVNEEVELIRH